MFMAYPYDAAFHVATRGSAMKYEIEFFWMKQDQSEWTTLRQEFHDFEDLNAAEDYAFNHTAIGLDHSPERADGFKIYENGVSQGTIFVRSALANTVS
jgi:hypothetical protein